MVPCSRQVSRDNCNVSVILLGLCVSIRSSKHFQVVSVLEGFDRGEQEVVVGVQESEAAGPHAGKGRRPARRVFTRDSFAHSSIVALRRLLCPFRVP